MQVFAFGWGELAQIGFDVGEEAFFVFVDGDSPLGEALPSQSLYAEKR